MQNNNRRIYTGTRHMGAAQVWVSDDAQQTTAPLNERQQLYNHSPDGFEWGYRGSGPAQLALAMLHEHTGDAKFALKHHQKFKDEVVAHLDGEFRMTGDQIQAWVDSLQSNAAGDAAIEKDDRP